MFFATALTALSAAALAVAQITVQVGQTPSATGGPLLFVPANVTASNGTTISFVFSGNPGNHTVTQSSFAEPCQPLAGGFDSGYIFVPNGTETSSFPTWNLTVTDDSRPIWFFCAQITAGNPHCTNGMVGSINAPTSGSNTFDAFRAAAIANKTAPNPPTPALSGIGAQASVAPGPFSGSVTGFSFPTGTLAAAAVGSGSSTGSASATGTAPATSTSSAAGTSFAVNSFSIVVAALFGVTLL